MAKYISSLFGVFLFFGIDGYSDQWPQASGPNANFITTGKAPSSFSVSKDQNIDWKIPLPNTGQGSVIISEGLAFVTSHEVIKKDTETGSLILGLCFDASTGKELWRREIPGTRTTDLSSLFSDNTAASPVADGKRVVFTNVGGTVKAFDFSGIEKWSHTWTPFGRHHARQHEPFIIDGNVVLMHAPRYDLPVAVTTKTGSHPLGRGREYWTYLQAYKLSDGERSWQAEPATSIHSTSISGKLANGDYAILTGRGGGHKPPEEPYGISLLNANNGKRIWDAEIINYQAVQNAHWNKESAMTFVGKEHRMLDIKSGKPKRAISLTDDVTICRLENGKYVTREKQRMAKAKKAITYMTNLLIGDYHYFRSFSGFMIGRVNIRTNKVEYLQVPAQVIRKVGKPDVTNWQKALPNDMRNANGFRATQDKRNAGNGWGHVSAASPIVVGDKIYFPTMTGMVYVLRWNAETLDEKALLSISDLGPAGETWSLSSLSYANGRIYARTMKELICIREK